MNDTPQIMRTQTGHAMPYVQTNDGKVRFLGRPASMVPAGRSAKMAKRLELLPDSQFVEFDHTPAEVALLDQGQVGECAGEGGAETVMVARLRAGQTHEPLSGSMLYAQVNGGQDEGSSLTDVVQALQTTGVCLASEVPEGFYTLPQIKAHYPTAMTTAKRFMTPIGSWLSFQTFDEAAALAQMGWQLYFSVTAGASWVVSRFSPDGVPPFIRGAGNHAQSGGEGMKKGKNGQWLIKVRNSWGEGWGLDGFYWIDSRFIDQQGQMEGYALTFTGQDPLDPNLGPVIA